MAKTITEYRRKMKNVLNQLLTMDQQYVEALFHGDPFDKIIRNISTRNENGEIFYNNKNMLNHYPRSEKANNIVDDDNLNEEEKVKLLYLEHDVPLKIIKNNLLDENNRSNDKLMKEVEKGFFVTLITKEESGNINKEYKSKMFDDGKTRYEKTGIKLIIQQSIK